MRSELTELAAGIELLILDVDGVLTDGRLYFSADGEEMKTFHSRDGYGIKKLMASGVQVAVISGRKSEAAGKRMNELGVEHVYLGCDEKIPTLKKILDALNLNPGSCAFMGDDVPDLGPMQMVALPLCVADAHPIVADLAKWQSLAAGGMGAVREACDLICAARQSERQ